MRFPKLLSWIVFCGVLGLSATARAQPTTRVPGRIIAVKVTGTVTATNLIDHTQAKLADNDNLSQHYVVTTAAASSAILVFSNGATLNLGADTTLSIDEFLQDPFDSQIKVGDLTEEPTTSSTKLNLSRGELVGNVKHLHEDKGSSFTVNTPVGAAGIRGTTFRIVFRPDASGNVFFTLSTADGSVVLATGPAAPAVHVDAGKEVVVNVDVTVNPDTGKVTINAPPVVSGTQAMSSDSQTQIAAAAQQIVEASSTVIIQSVTSSTSGTGTGTGDTNGKSDSTNKDTKDNSKTGNGNPTGSGTDSTTSNPLTPSSNTTPGDGQTSG